MIRMCVQDAETLEGLLTVLLDRTDGNELIGDHLQDEFLQVLVHARAALRSQLEDYRNGDRGQTELVDRIIYLVQKQGPGNYLGRSTITKLRKAILNPSELLKIEYASERLCPMCGILITGNNLTCVGDDNETLFCVHCTKPLWCPCKGCREPVSMTRTLYEVIRNIICGKCAEKQVAQGKVVVMEDDPQTEAYATQEHPPELVFHPPQPYYIPPRRRQVR